jgi:hypothetical protein
MTKRRRGHDFETTTKRIKREDVRDQFTKDNKIVARIAWGVARGCGNTCEGYI